MLSVSLEDFRELTGIRFENVKDSMFKSRHIKGISIDSRTIEPDQVFWALVGPRFNGHQFVQEARHKSALVAVVAEDEENNLPKGKLPLIVVPDTLKALRELAHLQRKKYNIPVIGITGSNGKTTVKEMLAHILQSKHTVHKTKGNMNNQVGAPLTLININEHHESAVVELGTNQFGEIAILTDMLRPNHGLITMIGDTHLEFLASREGVLKEKRELYDRMEKGSTIYLNLDDPLLAPYINEDLRVVSYASKKSADVFGEFGNLDNRGCGHLRLNDKIDIKLSVVGMHNLSNALAACAVALNLDFTEAEIKDALESYKTTAKRMQVINWNGTYIINDTYNANPASMNTAIETIKAMKHTGRTILVLGDMFELGEKSDEFHVQVLNQVIAADPDRVFLLGECMRKAMGQCDFPNTITIQAAGTHETVADILRNDLQPEDLVLLKGSRGMQMERVMAHL